MIGLTSALRHATSAGGPMPKAWKISDSISAPHSGNSDMPPDFNTLAPSTELKKSRTGRNLIVAAALIALAFVGLALVDRLRDRPAGLVPPHEPSEALITTPAQDAPAAQPEQPVTPPSPAKIVNNEILAPASRATGVTPLPQQATAKTSPAQITAPIPAKTYLVQLGIFNSPANAQALQKQLRRAGIDAHLETRVQLGPFKDKRDADKALARTKKLGIDAVLVNSR